MASEKVSVFLDPELLEKVEVLAKKEKRPRSNMIAVLVSEAIERREYLLGQKRDNH